MSENLPSLESIVKTLPHQPGCYLMLDENAKVIYIGAASNLKKRVSSYFRKDITDRKTKHLVKKINSIDYEIHSSEEEALLRERELIRIHSPKFNLDWKDDKQYPMIRITYPTSDEKFSRLFIVRDKSSPSDWYFGRKTDVKALRQSIREIRKIFPIANKSYCFRTKKVCLDYSIKCCSGPCVGKISIQDYQDIVEQLVLFLQGKRDDLLDHLYQKMNQASTDLKFEVAAKIRDRINQIERTIDTQKGFPQPRDRDLIIILHENNYYMLLIFWIRDTAIVNTESNFLGKITELPDSEIVKSFIQNYYLNAEFIPTRIEVFNHLNGEFETLEIWLSKKKGRTIQIVNAEKNTQDKRIKNEISRFQLILAERIRSISKKKELQKKALFELKDYLELKSLPKRIETYDISNIQGKLPVGSMIVFNNGEPIKSQYRRFKIKSVSPEPNDVAMLKEVLNRRLNHKDPSFALSIPDLIVVDGGKPQVNAIKRVLDANNKQIPVIGLAKKQEEVFLPEKKKSIPIPKNSSALRLLQQARDEAHRFAIEYHKKRRVTQLKSELDQIPGIGAKRRKSLFKHFGSIEAIRKATIEELNQVEGINRSLAERIFLNLISNSK